METRSEFKDNISYIAKTFAYSLKVAPVETVVIFFVSIGAIVAPILMGYVFKNVLDRLIRPDFSLNLVMAPFLVYLGIKAVSRVSEIVRSSLVFNFLTWKMQNNFWLDYHRKLFDVDIAAFEDSQTYNLFVKASDISKWKLADLVRDMALVVGGFITFVLALFVTVKFGYEIPLILILASIPSFIVSLKFSKALWSIFDSGGENYKKINYLASLVTSPSFMPELRIFGVKPKIFKSAVDIQRDFYDKNKTQAWLFGIGNVVAYLFAFAGSAFILLSQLNGLSKGLITVGEFTLIMAAVFALSDSLEQTLTSVGSVYTLSRQVGYYFQVLGMKPEIVEPDTPIVPEYATRAPRIEFRNVSFRYKEGARNILENLSFVIEPGENVALVGENGAGKSTIIKLLVRFYDVTEGEILINGVNIKEVDRDWWYKQLGTLFQQFIHYNFPVHESITLEAHGGDEAKMKLAAQQSGANEFIEKFPNGYNQMLGVHYENGTELSGGQWQKMALARAFYREPALLILDEPTSAIDAQAEFEIFNNINELYRDDKSLLIVSHRFSTVRNAEKILVLENGKIVEQGSHNSLMDLNGLYARMFNVQAEGYK